MKANEASKKLWWSEGAVWHTNHNSISYVEYTRADVFIEKTVKWINEHTSLSEKLVIENFVNYLKGE